MFITAKEARAISVKDPVPSIASVTWLCREIDESARRGNQFVVTETPISEEDYEWLTRNGYAIWERKEYMRVRKLISWFDDDATNES